MKKKDPNLPMETVIDDYDNWHNEHAI